MKSNCLDDDSACDHRLPMDLSSNARERRLACVRFLSVLTLASLFISTTSFASETLTYTYDALGRIVQVQRSGSVNNGSTSAYSYDDADNRTTVAVAVGGASLPPVLSVNDVTVGEGGGTAVFTVTKSGSGAASVSYATANGTATAGAGNDYTSKTGSLSFTATETSKTISVTIREDTADEPDENFLLNLSNASGGATISDAQGVATITDNDLPPAPVLTISNSTVTEAGNLSFTVTKANTTTSTVSVQFATANGTATAPADYTTTSGTLSFAPADTTKTVTVVTKHDVLVEPSETVQVNLSNATGGATIGDAQGVGTITDDDTAPPGITFTISDASGFEGNQLQFTVTKNGSTTSTFTVNYATATTGTASTNDFTAMSGTLTFAPADTQKLIFSQTAHDTMFEDDETYMMNLSNASTGSSIADNQGVGTIRNNDAENQLVADPDPPVVEETTTDPPLEATSE